MLVSSSSYWPISSSCVGLTLVNWCANGSYWQATDTTDNSRAMGRTRRFIASCSCPARLSGERREAQAQPERFQQAVERVLRRIVPRVDRAQHVRAGHAHLGCELLHAHGADHLPECKLQVHAFVD